MKTAKITRPGQPAKYIPNAVNYKGYLCAIRKKGVGTPVEKGGFNAYGEGEVWEEYERYEDFYVPYFNSEVVVRNWNREAFMKEKSGVGIEEIIGTEAEKALIRWGENEGGLLVEDTDDVNARKQRKEEEGILAGEITVEFYSGYMGYRIHRRLPRELWQKIKPYAEYVAGTEEDMEFLDDMGYYGVTKADIRGWAYQKQAIEVLLKEGVKVSYRGKDISGDEALDNQITRIDKEIREEEEAFKEKLEAITSKAKEYSGALSELYYNGEYVSKEEADEARKLSWVYLLDWKGANIYGGGKWLHVKGEDLYLVHNNGMDGDDWSRNNYETGGAGAICRKAEGQAALVKEIQNWVTSLGDDAKYLTGL